MCVCMAGVAEGAGYGEPPLSSHEEAIASIRQAANSVTSDIQQALEAMRLRKEQGALSPDSGPNGNLVHHTTLLQFVGVTIADVRWLPSA